MPFCRAKKIGLFLGAHDIDSMSETNRVYVESDRFDVHPDWNDNNLKGDIALVHLPDPVTFNGEFLGVLAFHLEIILKLKMLMGHYQITSGPFVCHRLDFKPNPEMKRSLPAGADLEMVFSVFSLSSGRIFSMNSFDFDQALF